MLKSLAGTGGVDFFALERIEFDHTLELVFLQVCNHGTRCFCVVSDGFKVSCHGVEGIKDLMELVEVGRHIGNECGFN